MNTAEIAAACGCEEKAMGLLREGIAPREYLKELMKHDLPADAIRFVAYALPKREAVWWAWVSARRASSPAPPPAVRAALDAAEQWIAQPTDERRRAVLNPAKEVGTGTPAGCAAMAAYLSGGSLAPAGAANTPPPEGLCSKVVAGAVLLAAAAAGEPEGMHARLRESIAQGMDVVNRIGLWL